MSRHTEYPATLTQPVTITFEGEALDALNCYRQTCHAARQIVAGSDDERETARLRAASDLAGWVSALVNVAN
ncbi:MAG: hypothetical protein K0S85_45 [Pseudomonas orientalis]|nr:hypothetical protein [Pseudomonas orientalis]